MRYKQYTVTPFWTSQTKMELLYDLQDKDDEIEYLKEQLKSEREYSLSVLECSEKLLNERNSLKNIIDTVIDDIKDESISIKSFIDVSIKQIFKAWNS